MPTDAAFFTPIHVQVLAALLFGLGLTAALARRDLFIVLMGIELMLNAVNLSFIGFARSHAGSASTLGQLAPLFTIAIAAAEACVALAMVVLLVRQQDTVDTDARSALKD
ncbi:MAG: NADH-quinone oxidoreductase subunit NuoK [Planctomycetota bacterium]|nr:NADH-quinone oxidoreductase subunit NuoK [Planctomycetota bacterium]MCX8039001.1 NADH-quinone oxidoreductase subunit NuoK [Planctomycetota bacterium]MDW8372748.1 NADH-quinone oxidoreductase subunit NuoK [Planctomycetota bacterium]